MNLAVKFTTNYPKHSQIWPQRHCSNNKPCMTIEEEEECHLIEDLMIQEDCTVIQELDQEEDLGHLKIWLDLVHMVDKEWDLSLMVSRICHNHMAILSIQI